MRISQNSGVPKQQRDGDRLEARDPGIAARDVRELVGDHAGLVCEAAQLLLGRFAVGGGPQQARAAEAPNGRTADAGDEANFGDGNAEAAGDAFDGGL